MNDGNKVIGIVGGMGPQAGATLFNSIVCHTAAATDQQHLPVILMSFPRHIVDRTAFLLGEVNTNPAFTIVQVINKLELAGAEVIGIACNTSHAAEIYDVIIEELEKAKSRVQIVHMPQATCRYIKEKNSNVRRVGLMTTNGTWKSGVYKNMLLQSGYEVVIPDIRFQQDVIHAIVYDPVIGIKSNPAIVTPDARILTAQALHYFEKRNTDAIILGCTELSMVIPEQIINGMLIIDSVTALARALIAEATGDKNAQPVSIEDGVYNSGKINYR